MQLSLFDETDLVEVRSDAYPGERLMVCRNPLLAEERRRKREQLLDGGVEVQGPPCGGRMAGQRAGRWGQEPMARVEPALLPAFQNRMRGDQGAVLEDARLAGVVPHVDDALARGVRNAVEVAAHGDHAVAADAPLDGERGAVGDGRQLDQPRHLLGEGLVHDAGGGGVDPWVGLRDAPMIELTVEIVEIAETPGQEEILADVAEGPLDPPLRLGAARAAGPGD